MRFGEPPIGSVDFSGFGRAPVPGTPGGPPFAAKPPYGSVVLRGSAGSARGSFRAASGAVLAAEGFFEGTAGLGAGRGVNSAIGPKGISGMLGGGAPFMASTGAGCWFVSISSELGPTPVREGEEMPELEIRLRSRISPNVPPGTAAVSPRSSKLGTRAIPWPLKRARNLP